MHCVTQAPRPLLCPDLDKWPPRDDDGPPRIGLSGDGTGVRRTNPDTALVNPGTGHVRNPDKLFRNPDKPGSRSVSGVSTLKACTRCRFFDPTTAQQRHNPHHVWLDPKYVHGISRCRTKENMSGSDA